MEAIKADEAKKTMKLSDEEKIEQFNSLIIQATSKTPSSDNIWKQFAVYLPFATFGGTYEDIQFIIDAGYKITADYRIERWTVSLYYAFDGDINSEDINITSAEEVIVAMPSIEYRRKCLFQNAVDSEIGKTEPTPFKLCLDFDIYGQLISDVQFIADLGYCINHESDDRYWTITLPSIPNKL